MGDEEREDYELSEYKGISPDKPTYSGLFQPNLFKTSLFKAKIVSSVTSRYLLWLCQWQANKKPKWQLASAPFKGGQLFGVVLDPILVEGKDKRKALPHLYRQAERRTTPCYKRQSFRGPKAGFDLGHQLVWLGCPPGLHQVPSTAYGLLTCYIPSCRPSHTVGHQENLGRGGRGAAGGTPLATSPVVCRPGSALHSLTMEDTNSQDLLS